VDAGSSDRGPVPTPTEMFSHAFGGLFSLGPCGKALTEVSSATGPAPQAPGPDAGLQPDGSRGGLHPEGPPADRAGVYQRL